MRRREVREAGGGSVVRTCESAPGTPFPLYARGKLRSEAGASAQEPRPKRESLDSKAIPPGSTGARRNRGMELDVEEVLSWGSPPA